LSRSNIILSLGVVTYVALIALIWVSNESLCTSSKIVQNIDIIDKGAKSQYFNCSLNAKSKYSPENEDLISQLDQRIDLVYQFLNMNTRFNLASKIQIEINFDRQLVFEVSKNKVHIGSLLLNEPGALERAIIKVWLRQSITDSLLIYSLFEESMTDLVYFTFAGKLHLSESVTKREARVGQHRWPQVLKSFEEYCESPWKMLEHAESCSRISSERHSETISHFIEMSLRPLTTQSFLLAYNDLSFFDRQQLIEDLGRNLNRFSMGSDKAVDTILKQENPITEGLVSLQTFSSVLSDPNFFDQPHFKKFTVAVSEQLERAGVTDSFAEAYVDYLVTITEPIDRTNALFKSLEKAAQKDSKVQIALTDYKSIWILPYGDRLPFSSFKSVRARHLFFFACPTLKEFRPDNFFGQAEKLTLIKGCDQQRPVDFSSLSSDKPMDFLRSNSKLSFVQFHLPSLEMRKLEMKQIKNFFELVRTQKFESDALKALGWTQVQWSDETKSYKPKAAIDAIQYFRLNDSDL